MQKLLKISFTLFVLINLLFFSYNFYNIYGAEKVEYTE